MIKSAVLCSGGLDSTTLVYYLIDKSVDFIPLFIDYGQHCVQKEYETLLDVLPSKYKTKLVKIELSSIYSGCKSRLISEPDLWQDDVVADDLYLPYRNLLLLSAGAAFAQSRGMEKIYAAFINSNHAKEIDCSAEFFSALSAIFSNYGSVQIEMPFRYMSKYEVAKIGMELNAPIANTFSCQASSKVPCGACPNCVDRLEALSEICDSLKA